MPDGGTALLFRGLELHRGTRRRAAFVEMEVEIEVVQEVEKEEEKKRRDRIRRGSVVIGGMMERR